MAPSIWGHRGASARYPENSLEGFKAAIEDGAAGIESDVHITRDGVVLCCHDPHLDRTTDGKGSISSKNYHGQIDRLRTTKKPCQPIPTFAQTIEMLCQPRYAHAVLDVDVKVDNDPERLFTLMHEIISRQPAFETSLAPRIVLGLWHPVFLEPARRILPYCRRSHISFSTQLSRDYFWEHCYAFSMRFNILMTPDGQKFLQEAHAAGKQIFVWTVNRRHEAIEAARWGCNVIITDHTRDMVSLMRDIEADWKAVNVEPKPQMSWLSVEYNPLLVSLYTAWGNYLLHRSPVGPIVAVKA